MDGSRMLSGSQLVAKGATKKVDGQLPEVGLKEVAATGSWLEQKQIQSALEAQKHLIAVERIEKSGSLSHAVWRDDLKLAEVTKQAGGYWQYFGHKRGQCLYLLPEEALFLMETNSLLLKHNEVTVSLQKAYPLCLTEISIMQYKLYASLSRLGYRVFRHKEPTSDGDEQNMNKETTVTAIGENLESQPVSMNTDQTNSELNIVNDNMEVSENNALETVEDNTNNLKDSLHKEGANEKIVNENDSEPLYPNSTTVNDKSLHIEETVSTIEETNNVSESNTSEEVTTRMDVDDNANEMSVTNGDNNGIVSASQDPTPDETVAEDTNALAPVYSIDELGVVRVFEKEILEIPMETDSSDSNVALAATDSCDLKDNDPCTTDSYKHYQAELKRYDDKIIKITERKSNDQRSNIGLDTLQDFYKQKIVKVTVPDEKHLPRNIFLHKTEYTLNMEVVRTQNASNVSDERDSIQSSPAPSQNTNSQRLANLQRFGTANNMPHRYPNYHQRHYNPRQNYNNYMSMFSRNLPSYYGHSRYHPRYQPNSYYRQHYMVYNVNMPGMNANRQPSRQDTIKKYHYDMIVNIATRLKNGLAFPSQVRALHNLLNTYNVRYNTNITMTQDFTIIGTLDTVNTPRVVELNDDKVISLDDEPERKKPRLNDNHVNYNSNLEKLKVLAAKLKQLHAKNLAVSRHRRVFSNAIKTFNKSFKADLHLDSSFEIVDRTTVVVDTSSDSDAVIIKEKEKPKKRKQLRNPYNILKRMANDVNVGASTSKQVPVLRTLSLNVINDTSRHKSENANVASTVVDDKDDVLKCFYQARFPGSDEFGRAVVCSRVDARLDALLFQAEYLDDVLKESLAEFESWVDIKLTILKEIRGTLNLQKQQVEALSKDFFTTESQIQPILGPDCTDLKSALKKLAIIPTNKEIPANTSLRIHFDVCNRDVHFKKSSPPRPNFRVVCYDEKAPFPSTDDVVALGAKYSDGVPIVFAFIGGSASISYLQINPIDLAVFIPDLA